MADKKYSDIDLSKYANGFQKSDALTSAEGKQASYEDLVANYGKFSSEKQGLADNVLNQYLNRDKFSYDFNADALYQQYKDKYIQQGKMAMQDAIGQASAMTGGYGNSYAATVGNQAYQAHLQNLNDVIPELYQLAYDRYNQEGQDMLNQYSLLGDAVDREYGMWSDELGRLMNERGYYGDQANNLYNREYGAWNDNRTYDTNQYWNETNFGYGVDQDALANDRAERELQMREEAWEQEKNDYELVSGAVGGSDTDTSTSDTSTSQGSIGLWDSKNPHGYSPADIRALQRYAGITVDGKWGPQTEAAYKQGYRPYGQRAVKDGETVWKETVTTVGDVEGNINEIIENATDPRKAKSEVNTYLREALNAKIINQKQYNSLKSKYAPSGGVY